MMAEPETIPQFIRQISRDFGAREAVVLGGTRRTFDDLDHRSRLLARALLGAGVGKGSRVGILLGNGPNWVEAWFAIARIGAVTVPLSTFFKPAELRKAIRHADLSF